MTKQDETFSIVDAHHHFWDLGMLAHPWLCDDKPIPFRYGDYTSIKQNYLYDDYRRDSTRHNVVASVHMEAEWNPADPIEETRWLSGYAAAHDLPTVLIGQAWFCRDDIETVLRGHAEFDLVRGVRQKPAAAPTPEDFKPGAQGSMADPKFREGYSLLSELGLSFDLQTPWWHLSEAADLARDFPQTQIIINHTGLPSDRSKSSLIGWQRAIQTASELPNIAIKISGIGVTGYAWTVDLNRKIVLDTIDTFGVERCMFASNYPVDSLCASYDTLYNGYKEITADFSAQDRLKLFHGNAVKYYRI